MNHISEKTSVRILLYNHIDPEILRLNVVLSLHMMGHKCKHVYDTPLFENLLVSHVSHLVSSCVAVLESRAID